MNRYSLLLLIVCLVVGVVSISYFSQRNPLESKSEPQKKEQISKEDNVRLQFFDQLCQEEAKVQEVERLLSTKLDAYYELMASFPKDAKTWAVEQHEKNSKFNRELGTLGRIWNTRIVRYNQHAAQVDELVFEAGLKHSGVKLPRQIIREVSPEEEEDEEIQEIVSKS